jgi:hypothetical protein
LALRNQIARIGAAAATVAIAALSLAGPASAQGSTGVTVTPTTVQTSAVFSAAGAKAYEGDAGVLTVTVAANTVFEAGQPIEFEECNLDPTSQGACDGLTLQTTNVGGKTAVTPASNGSVTFTMDLWILPTGNSATTPDVTDPNNNNPSGFDNGSTVVCDANDPCSIWIGDDPSNWNSNSYVFDGLTPEPNTTPLPAPTTTTIATTSTTGATTSTTGATTSTTGATTSTTGSSTSTTGASTSTTGASTSTTGATTTTQPSGGQVPESPYVSLLPVAALGLIGAGFVTYRVRHRRAQS